jgi:hypothetical protein
VHRADESVEFHRNGMPFGSGESRLPEVTGRIENSLGRSQYGDFRYFPGRLTELVLYNRALPEEDARSIEAYLAEHWDCCTD